MADIVDMAGEIEAEHIARSLARAALPIPAGHAGECDDCGEIMPRLVNGRCGFCRDGRVPPPGWTPPADTTARREESTMPAKTICLPATAATAIAAIDQLAQQSDIPLGQAAAQLIERGAAAAMAASADPVPIDLTSASLFDLLGAALTLVEAREDDSAACADLAAAIERAEAAEARAEAAEGKLQRLKEAMAA
jgi:hypothetical protein